MAQLPPRFLALSIGRLEAVQQELLFAEAEKVLQIKALAVGVVYITHAQFVTPLSDDDSAGDLNSRITATLPDTGSYRIVAAALSSGSSGAYELTLESR